MNSKEDYENELKTLRNKCINLIDNQPSNRQELHRFMNRMIYIRGILQGLKIANAKKGEREQ